MISAIYRPPSNSSYSKFIELFSAFLGKLNLGEEHILCGDFNADFQNLSASSPANKLKILTDSFGFSQIIKSVTRNHGSHNSKTTIDLIFVNNINKYSNAGVISYKISDHYITYAIFKANRLTSSSKKIP